ncbi:hypothetical protein GQ457_04G026470 [Hibiscus cannabinus]
MSLKENKMKHSMLEILLMRLTFVDGTEKVQRNHCKIKLVKNKDGSTTQYKMHVMNLLVHDGIFEIKDVIENVRENVKHITISIVCLTMFNDIVKQLQLPNKRLILDYCTRWNATYPMLSCAIGV